jgi:hypothetical protein
MAAGQLGGDKLSTFLAQRGLRQAMSGPAFQESPLSEQLMQLTQAAAPYGQKGQQLAQQYAQALQMRGQEAQQRQQQQQQLQAQEQEKQTASQLWEQLYPGKPVPPGLSSKDILGLAKVTHKAPPGGTTSQPIPPEVSNRIRDVIRQNPKASAEELNLAFDEANIPPIYSGKYVQTRREDEERSKSQEFELGKEKRKRETELSSKVLAKADEAREQLPLKESALGLMNDAIVNKDMSFWTQDNLAEATGIEGFRSKEGAVFKTAGKEYLLGNMKRAGARPNQWIEQQIADAQAKIGRSTGANLSVTRALQNEIEIEKNRLATTAQLAKKYEDELGYVPSEFGAQIFEANKAFAEEKQKELYNDLRAIKSIEDKSKEVFHKVKEGTPISKFMVQALLRQYENNPEKAREEAKKLGYAF